MKTNQKLEIVEDDLTRIAKYLEQRIEMECPAGYTNEHYQINIGGCFGVGELQQLVDLIYNR